MYGVSNIDKSIERENQSRYYYKFRRPTVYFHKQRGSMKARR